MTIGFYAGALLILSTIFMYPLIKNRKRKKISEKHAG